MTESLRKARQQRETECPHIRGTVKWGIARSQEWCDKCKRFVPLKIDWSGHP
jgi:hypothetical protein